MGTASSRISARGAGVMSASATIAATAAGAVRAAGARQPLRTTRHARRRVFAIGPPPRGWAGDRSGGEVFGGCARSLDDLCAVHAVLHTASDRVVVDGAGRAGPSPQCPSSLDVRPHAVVSQL